MSQANVKEQLLQQLKASTVNEATHEETETIATGTPNFFSRANRIEVAAFMREFSILSRAEYPVVRALNLLSENTSNSNLRSTITQISGAVQTGTTLSAAFDEHPWYFDKVTISVVRAAEASGRLSEGLNYIADQYEYDQEIKDKVVTAMTYPAVLTVISFAVIAGVLTFIIPQFGAQLTDAGGKLEGLAAFVFSISQFVSHPIGIAATAAALILPTIGVIQWRRQNEASFTNAVSRIPIIGRIVMLGSITRFVNMLQILLSNDVKALQALELARGAVNNTTLRNAVSDMHANVEKGQAMASALDNYSAFPHVFRDMIAVGEESGKLTEMLSHLAKTMKNDLNRTTDRIMVLLQPFLLVFLGGIVLSTFIVFFVPYFELLTTLSQIK
jgi:type IV pilus assembly protein PilC